MTAAQMRSRVNPRHFSAPTIGRFTRAGGRDGELELGARDKPTLITPCNWLEMDFCTSYREVMDGLDLVENPLLSDSDNNKRCRKTHGAVVWNEGALTFFLSGTRDA
jgi:hypothetical protein